MELNFTNCTQSFGILFDKNEEFIVDIIIKKDMREFYILTITHRLFSIYIYDRININDPITF
jgi:hypothetical protein